MAERKAVAGVDVSAAFRAPNVRLPPIAVTPTAGKLTLVVNARSYGPDKLLVGSWAMLLSPLTFLYLALLLKHPDRAAAVPFWIALAPLIPVIFASRFRATFTATSFEYQRWGPTIRVRYSDIARIEVSNKTPMSNQAIGAFIITKNGKRFPFWPKLFPREAVNRFFAMA